MPPEPETHPRFLALLRGINVGGKNIVPKDALRKCFEDLGYRSVRTYIQSGNILFRSAETDVTALTDEIEHALSVRFSYDARAPSSCPAGHFEPWSNRPRKTGDVTMTGCTMRSSRWRAPRPIKFSRNSGRRIRSGKALPPVPV